PVFSPLIARTPTPCSIEWAPSRTIPSSTVQLSRRACWKYRSPKSIPGPSRLPKARSRPAVSRPAGCRRRDWASCSGRVIRCSGKAIPDDMRARSRASTAPGPAVRFGHPRFLIGLDDLHLRVRPRAGDVVGAGADLAHGLLQHGVGGRADRGADRSAGDRPGDGEQVAGAGQHLDGLVVALRAQVGRAADVDVRGGAGDVQVVGAGNPVAEADRATGLVEGEAAVEEVAEIEG